MKIWGKPNWMLSWMTGSQVFGKMGPPLMNHVFCVYVKSTMCTSHIGSVPVSVVYMQLSVQMSSVLQRVMEIDLPLAGFICWMP